jgi:hypothetical protein
VPPDIGRGGGPTAGTAHHHHQTARHHPNGFFDGNTPRGHCGRFAGAWREGFAYGFRAAIRQAGRLLGPETWHTLEELADEFELAGVDD